ncbi:hypothetical protein M514_12562 [Trichuris suis]|uniref:Uncharacterized protein n=1 Tax=Trichuris suis TaxID=68888 RepID=A0A085N6D5_9BILA|nr:hypothetical protein M513_12562 [Trichuris suis]KFD65031.1 hypothetical protein M514_12562 [Trichuris suis]
MWLACDNEDAGFQILNGDETVVTLSNSHGEPDEGEEELYDDEMLVNVCPSHKKAYQCLEVALQWFEMQEECDPKRMLFVNYRDLAANKRKTAIKQTSITDFFKYA